MYINLLKGRIAKEQQTSQPSSVTKPSVNVKKDRISEEQQTSQHSPTMTPSEKLEISLKKQITKEQQTSQTLSPALRLPKNLEEWMLEEQETSDPMSPALKIVRNPEVTSQLKTPMQTPTFDVESTQENSQLAIISLKEDSECQILDKAINAGQSNDLVYIEDVMSKAARPRTLAANQKSPFEGSFVVKRLIDDDTEIAPNSYNPFRPVQKSKVNRLCNLIRREL